MERISKDQLDVLIDFAKLDLDEKPGPQTHCRFLAFTELRERRSADTVAWFVCPDCGKRVSSPHACVKK